MPIKTFVSGEILTASDTNAYLNNGGLVYITQASWSSGSTVSVNNCFTSTYSAYRLVVRNAKHATITENLVLRMRASGVDASTGYYWALNSVSWTGTNGVAALANTDSYRTVTANVTNAGSCVIDVIDPQKANVTGFSSQGSVATTTGETRTGTGFLNNTTAYDGFSLLAASGNLTALTVFVYGYRES